MSVQLVSFYYKCTFSIGMSKLYHVWTSLCHLMLLQSHLQPLTKIKLEQVKFFVVYLTINALHLSLILQTQWHILLSKKMCYMTRLTYEKWLQTHFYQFRGLFDYGICMQSTFCIRICTKFCIMSLCKLHQ